MMNTQNNSRILIIDDNPSIHNDFRKILTNNKSVIENINTIEKTLFGESVSTEIMANEIYSLDYALSGEQGVKMVEKAKEENDPYAMAFVDVRMPPGWDGIETITRIWEIDPFIEIALCTAYSDYSWDQIISKIGYTDHIIIIKKPFEKIEIKQMASALIQKWNSATRARINVKKLENKMQQHINVTRNIIKFANILNSLQNIKEICKYLLEFTAKIINCERISIMLPDENTENLSIITSIGIQDEILENTIIKIGEGIAGKAFLSEETLLVNNIEESIYRKKYSSYDSFLIVPIIYRPLNKTSLRLGVINLTNKKGNKRFTNEEVTLMSFISDTAAVALHNQINKIKNKNTLLKSIKALIRVIEEKDPYSKGHSDQVSLLARCMGQELKLSHETIETVSLAGLLHDIGKIRIPKSILIKPEKLTVDEFELIKKHTKSEEQILKDSNFSTMIMDCIRHHHERLDGSGYPDRLKGNEISIEARIIAVADIFAAMKSHRSYRKAIPEKIIKKELMQKCGITLDFKCVQALFTHLGI